MEAKKMDDIKIEATGLLHPDYEVHAKSGEIVFKVKKKYDPNLKKVTHVFFEKNFESLSDEEKLEFNEIWNMVKSTAIREGWGLFDISEYREVLIEYLRAFERVKDIVESKEADEVGESVNFRTMDISLFDHATEKITSLTIGGIRRRYIEF